MATILANEIVATNWQLLTEKSPTEKNKERTLLEKHLSDYTAKNTADYFIHKDLGGFLKRELDFYIKNEVMNLDDIDNAQTADNIAQNLRLIQTLRAIAFDIIAFLAQLENFQKRLWEKKKFVADCHYLITLDNIPSQFYDEIFANEKQIQEWQNLYGAQNIKRKNVHLVVNTSLFNHAFQAKLLATFDDLDNEINGTIIHSDNFQALNLLQNKYQGQVKCIYIDPPYNTGDDGFVYKDNYQSSSWLTLMENRVLLARKLLAPKSALFCQISDIENTNLNKLMVSIFGIENHRETISVVTSSKSGVNAINVKRGERLFKIKEYLHFYSNNPSFRFNSFYTPDNYNTNYKWEIYQLDNGDWYVCDLKKDKRLSDVELENYALDNPQNIYSIEKNNSKAGEAMKAMLEKSKESQTVEKFTDQFGVTKLIYQGGVCVPLQERIIQENGNKYFGVLGSDIWDDIGQASKSEGGVSFDNGKKPEKLLKRVIEMATQENDLVLDYFSGSGTTACVAQKLGRKWIAIEQGEYFESILMTRIKKTLFGEQTGISKTINYLGGGFVKVLKLESYEDTLNNLQLKSSDLFDRLPENTQKDYVLNYMLNIESRESLLNVADFAKPFDYELNITTDSAGAYNRQKIDLVETFNYLIGANILGITDRRDKEGVVEIECQLPYQTNDDKTLIFWRDCEKVGYDDIKAMFEKRSINPKESNYQEIYINGDHTLDTVWENADGTQNTLKIKSIEQAFLDLMFGEI
ncbi:site-specific DNA-methyltransferase [Wielerella bovis]|uniref:site-specific DNA-methyltransferase n=1 Tax=Wielerella bovis TaxID=2917790 RepID=UPI002019F2AB|nr:site-specific DNA-methyltransferase [Wielerella bovis]ULJ61930.1 site-specific DNA-methyltransferase [Wielerella bovis]